MHESRQHRANIARAAETGCEAVSESRLGFLNLLNVDELGTCGDQRLVDRVADVSSMGNVGESGKNQQHSGILLIRKVAEQLIDRLVLNNQLAIQLGRFGQINGLDQVQRRHVFFGCNKGRPAKRHDQPRLRGAIPLVVLVLRSTQWRLDRHIYFVVTAFPATPVFLHKLKRGFRIDIANKNDRGFLRTVPAIEKRVRVLDLVRHHFDVFEQAHRRVLVSVLVEHQVADALQHHPDRVRNILEVLAFYGQRFCTERFLGVDQILEAIGLHFDDLFQVVFGERGVVIGVIVGCIGIRVRAGFLQDIDINIRRVFFGAAKHHVLKEMREARLARLYLIA